MAKKEKKRLSDCSVCVDTGWLALAKEKHCDIFCNLSKPSVANVFG